jgi:hypothetical protein
MRLSEQEPPTAEESAGSSEPEWAFKGTLLPGFASRFFRPLSITASGIDQLDKIFDGTIDPVTGQPNFKENTAKDLYKAEVTVKPGKILRSTAELKEAYSIALDKQARNLIDISSDPLLATPSGLKLVELAWSDAQGMGKRFLSAIDASFAWTERSPFAGTTPIPRDPLDEDETEFIYAITLDLDALAVFPSEALEAYQTLELHTKLSPENRAGLDPLKNQRCQNLNPTKCLREVSGVGVRGRWLAGVLPKITFKEVDQFDFILAGGEPFPFNEDALATISVTWDLGAALDSAKHRRDAIKALALHRTLAARDGRRDLEPVLSLHRIRVPYGFPMPVQLKAVYRGEPDDPAIARKPESVQWTLETVTSIDGQSGMIEQIRVTKAGELEAWEAPSGTYKLRLCLVDDVNNYSRNQQELEVVIE